MASYYKTDTFSGHPRYCWATSYPVEISDSGTPDMDVPAIDVPRTEIPDDVGWDEDNEAWLPDKLNVGAGRLRNQLVIVGSDDSGNGKIYFEDV